MSLSRSANHCAVRRLAGIVLGLSLLIPTLHFEADLVSRVTGALDDGDALSTDEMLPPIDFASALDALSSALHDR